MTRILKVGDTVEWVDDWNPNSSCLPQQVKVDSIRLIEDQEEVEVPAVPWSACKEREVAVLFRDKNKWAYGYQIKPCEEETCDCL